MSHASLQKMGKIIRIETVTQKRRLENENVKRTQKTAKLSENEKIQQNHALTIKLKQIRTQETPEQRIKRLEVLKMYTKQST